MASALYGGPVPSLSTPGQQRFAWWLKDFYSETTAQKPQGEKNEVNEVDGWRSARLLFDFEFRGDGPRQQPGAWPWERSWKARGRRRSGRFRLLPRTRSRHP